MFTRVWTTLPTQDLTAATLTRPADPQSRSLGADRTASVEEEAASTLATAPSTSVTSKHTLCRLSMGLPLGKTAEGSRPH